MSKGSREPGRVGMAEDGGEEAWLSWRSIPRLAASVASVPLVVGYASVGAARLLGRSVGEVLRGASWALDQIVRNTERSKAVGKGLRKSRKPAKGSRDSRRLCDRERNGGRTQRRERNLRMLPRASPRTLARRDTLQRHHLSPVRSKASGTSCSGSFGPTRPAKRNGSAWRSNVTARRTPSVGSAAVPPDSPRDAGRWSGGERRRIVIRRRGRGAA